MVVNLDNEHWKARPKIQLHSTRLKTKVQLVGGIATFDPLLAGGHLPYQKHLRCTMVGPDSSYSPLEIHICWNVLKEDKIEPPIQTEYLRSGGATTLIFMVGAKAVNSLVMRSPNMVVPSESTALV